MRARRLVAGGALPRGRPTMHDGFHPLSARQTHPQPSVPGFPFLFRDPSASPKHVRVQNTGMSDATLPATRRCAGQGKACKIAGFAADCTRQRPALWQEGQSYVNRSETMCDEGTPRAIRASSTALALALHSRNRAFRRRVDALQRRGLGTIPAVPTLAVTRRLSRIANRALDPDQGAIQRGEPSGRGGVIFRRRLTWVRQPVTALRLKDHLRNFDLCLGGDGGVRVNGFRSVCIFSDPLPGASAFLGLAGTDRDISERPRATRAMLLAHSGMDW